MIEWFLKQKKVGVLNQQYCLQEMRDSEDLVKKTEYATNKWEKRKDSILDYEMARFKKVEELLDYREKEKKEKLRYMYSLCLAYRQVLEVLFISKKRRGIY